MTGFLAAFDFVAVTIFVVTIFFLPSIIAYYRKDRYLWLILVLNGLLGWTKMGWVVLLIWAIIFHNKQKPGDNQL